VGPPALPATQAPVVSHQPHPAVVVQASQPGDDEQGSVGCSRQALWYHRHSEHTAHDGPASEPVRQVPLPAHQPQSRSVVQSSQVVASAHGSPAVTHDPPWHTSPAQQSSVEAQLWAPTRQPQTPAWQVIQPQQSAVVVHAPAVSTQHREVVGLVRQLRPPQHWPTAAHASDDGVHAFAGAWQVPPVHSSPVRHGCPTAQQGWVTPPHVGAWQLPPLQVPAHAVVHAPQLRGSVPVSTQAPAQQAAPPLHVVPEQQACPTAPQAPAAVTHRPPAHWSPAWHEVPLQHDWWAPPHAGATSQVPAVHTKPEAHAVLAQHGWREPPHSAGVTQLPPWHTSPEPHTLPVQHGWLCRPQVVALTQLPP
jgi:hypothetical protein